MTSGAMFRIENAFAPLGVARVFEKLPGPKVAQQFPHLARVKMRRFCRHLGRVIPHRRWVLRQGPAFDLGTQRRAGSMAPDASFRGEKRLAVSASAGFKSSRLFAR